MSYHVGPAQGVIDKSGLEPVSTEDFKELTMNSSHIVFGSVRGKLVVINVDYHGLEKEKLKKYETYRKGNAILAVGNGSAHVFSDNRKEAVEIAAHIDPRYGNLLESYSKVL